MSDDVILCEVADGVAHVRAHTRMGPSGPIQVRAGDLDRGRPGFAVRQHNRHHAGHE